MATATASDAQVKALKTAIDLAEQLARLDKELRQELGSIDVKRLDEQEKCIKRLLGVVQARKKTEEKLEKLTTGL